VRQAREGGGQALREDVVEARVVDEQQYHVGVGG
jgi:hypothetical protein